MMRRVNPTIVALAAVFALAGCDKETASPLDLGSETIRDDSGEVEVGISVVELPGSHTELRFELKAIGTEEMDKIALDVALDQMWLVEGGAQWSGFVPPRQPQSHRVVVEPIEGASAPAVRVSVSRFRDSEVLMHREIPFSAAGDPMVEGSAE